MTMTVQRSVLARAVMLSGAVLLSAQVVAAPGGNNGRNNPGAGHRQDANAQHQMMMDEAETRRDQAGQMRERGNEEMERHRDRAEDDAERMRERAENEAERGRERGEAEAERMRERAENETERGREQAESEMAPRSGRPENAGSPEVNPGERGSEQGQAAKREHSKAWWNFWD